MDAMTCKDDFIFVCRYFKEVFSNKGYDWNDQRLNTQWFSEDQTDGGLEMQRHKAGICALNNLSQEMKAKLPSIHQITHMRKFKRPFALWKCLVVDTILGRVFYWGHIAAALYASADYAYQLEVATAGGKGGAYYVAEWVTELLSVTRKSWFYQNGGNDVGGWAVAIMGFYRKYQKSKEPEGSAAIVSNPGQTHASQLRKMAVARSWENRDRAMGSRQPPSSEDNGTYHCCCCSIF
jgi:hypothetical protein